MTLVGKIFTMLIMIMSLVFMSFAVVVYATHKNWRDEVKRTDTTGNKALGYEEQVKQLEVEKTDLDAQITALDIKINNEKSAMQDAVAGAEADLKVAKQRVAQLEASQLELEKTLRQATETLDSQQITLASRREEVGQLRKDLVNTSRTKDQYFGEVVKLTSISNELQGELDRLEAQQLELTKQIASLNRVIAHADINPHDPSIYANPPSVEGVITHLNEDQKLIQISLGSDDGIMKDHELVVYRMTGASPKYLGRVIVLKSTPDQAVCKVLQSTKQAPFERADHVTPRLR